MKKNSEKIKDMIVKIRELRKKVKNTISTECQCINCSERRVILEIKNMSYQKLWEEMQKAEDEEKYEKYYKFHRELCDRNESLAKVFQENGIKKINEVIEFLKK